MKYILYTFLSIININYGLNLFNYWHCIGIVEKIDLSKPYPINIGELPLVIWKNGKNNKLLSTVNICKHMGSKLSNAKITEDGCLKCQYHGLEFSENDKFGEIMEYEGKLFWSFEPIKSKPEGLPHYNNNNYEKTYLEIDMECSLTDSAYNTMDLRHPEYVHSQLVGGFGSAIPPENIKCYKYKSNDRVGLSFDYSSNRIVKIINDNIVKTRNFHMYVYPSFSWSKVSIEKKNLIIGVNLLPLEKNKTRWYITVCHNYYKSELGKNFMKMLTLTILNQDFVQMQNQYTDNDLKDAILFKHIFNDEEPIIELRKMFKNYKYPDIKESLDLFLKRNK
jgi:nitrite reductase/ring-hydroxylating ferredoxin subunit